MRWRARPWPRFRALDVRALARLAAPTLADHGLDRLCEWLGLEIKGRHTALGDAEATGQVFLALVPLLRAKNIRTLAEAEAASRSLAEQEARSTGGYAPGGNRSGRRNACAGAPRQLPLPPPRARCHEHPADLRRAGDDRARGRAAS